MHEEIDVLALGSRNQYVAHCGYGCVNLVWGRVSIHLTHHELLQLEQFMVVCEAELLDLEMYGDADNFVLCHENGFREVWLMGVGLYLKASNFKLLVTLVQDAADHLKETMESSVFD